MKIREGGRLDGLLKRVSFNIAFHDRHMNHLRRVRRMYLVGGEDVGPYYGQADPSFTDDIADFFYEIIRPHLSEKQLEYGKHALNERVLKMEKLLAKSIEKDAPCF
jgi:hypothetical protein